MMRITHRRVEKMFKKLVLVVVLLAFAVAFVPVAVVLAGDCDRTHSVAPGQGLMAIGRLYGVSAEEIARVNGLTLNSMLRVGQRLCIPGGGSAAPAATVVPNGGVVTSVGGRTYSDNATNKFEVFFVNAASENEKTMKSINTPNSTGSWTEQVAWKNAPSGTCTKIIDGANSGTVSGTSGQLPLTLTSSGRSITLALSCGSETKSVVFSVNYTGASAPYVTPTPEPITWPGASPIIRDVHPANGVLCEYYKAMVGLGLATTVPPECGY